MNQSLDKILTKENVKGRTLETKTKQLSSDFTKLKTQLLKVSEDKSQPEKVKMVTQIQNCENIVKTIMTVIE